jgi:hypothetical protein
MTKILEDLKNTPAPAPSTDPLEHYRVALRGIEETSKKIRVLHKMLGDSDKKVAQIERLLKQLGVTTKAGEPIRYQHVRNVLTQVLGSVK